MKLYQLITVISLLVTPTLASPGDNLDEFQHCLEACEYSVCHTRSTFYENKFLSLPFTDASPLLKYLLLWDCPSNCDYQCQQIITAIRVQRGEEIYQFHGKWPFKRLLATQELASTVFSMLNFIPHYLNFFKAWSLYQCSVGSKKILYWNVVIIAIVTMCAWTFSTIFHLRDTIVTERLDYFFAGATVLSGFHGLLIRVMRYDQDQTRRVWANITVALAQYGLLLVLSYQHYKKAPQKRSLWIKPLLLIASVVFGMSFEVFDFINLNWQIDAHAVWHATTVIPGFWLYEFLFEDIDSINDKYLD
ncbi:Protein PER1 [Cyberlindnera fabianii]|uniref:Post-GPI attachment to proteins factor 3 n=1 Tax=Cyberlindnera fabianii TaxID=36022 RepID=A0A1V2KZU9_CYBFA|nr:Protein PER1 [Cyberlindnera fabianii]